MKLWTALRIYTAWQKGEKMASQYGYTTWWAIAAAICGVLATVFGAIHTGGEINWPEIVATAGAIASSAAALIRLRVAVSRK